MTFIKFCGMTREEDVRVACDLGVDAIGFVMWPKSPRYVAPAHVVSLIKAMPYDVMPVGVFVSPTVDDVARAREAGVRVMQIHGSESSSISAVEQWGFGALQPWFAASLEGDLEAIPTGLTLVLDAHDPIRHGGTGRTIDWTRAAAVAAERQILLAGGLTAANVASAIRQVKPFGVDVASGIEDRPGIKNAQAMKAFVAAVRGADQ